MLRQKKKSRSKPSASPKSVSKRALKADGEEEDMKFIDVADGRGCLDLTHSLTVLF